MHSGDVQSAPQGAAEFIDINVECAREMDVRYALMSTISYSGQPFSEFKAHAGMMTRNNTRGQRVDPTTVETKFTVESKAVHHIPVLFDLDTYEMVWVDIAGGGAWHMRVSTLADRIAGVAQGMLAHAAQSPTMYDLIALNAEARGTRVNENERSDADHTVHLEDVVDDVAGTMSQWMEDERNQGAQEGQKKAEN